MADSTPSTVSNPELEAALAKCQTAEEIRETTLQVLARQGQIIRSRDDEFNHRIVPQPPRPAADSNVSLAVSGYRCERFIEFGPKSTKRPLVIRANSEAELDALEDQIRGS